MWKTVLHQKSENVRPHSSNCIENATPSSGTSPLASYKEVPSPPPPGILKDRKKLYPFYHVRAILIQLEIGIISFWWKDKNCCIPRKTSQSKDEN